MRRLHTVKVNQEGDELNAQFKENITGRCLKTNDATEKEKVGFVLNYLLINMGSDETVKLLTDLDEKNLRFVDILNTLEAKVKNRDVLPLPKHETNPIDRVRVFLWQRYGQKAGDEKLRVMSGEQCVSLDEEIRKGRDVRESESGALIIPPLFQREGYEPKRESESGALRYPSQKEILTGKPEEKKDTKGPLTLPKTDYTKK